jgi:hypothetical protein
MGVHVMVEGAIVSHGPVPMRPQLVRCRLGLSNEGEWESLTSGESTSGKSSGCWCGSHWHVIPGDGTEAGIWSTYEQRESRRRDER